MNTAKPTGPSSPGTELWEGGDPALAESTSLNSLFAHPGVGVNIAVWCFNPPEAAVGAKGLSEGGWVLVAAEVGKAGASTVHVHVRLASDGNPASTEGAAPFAFALVLWISSDAAESPEEVPKPPLISPGIAVEEEEDEEHDSGDTVGDGSDAMESL
mmetsp:Transcript_30287/g.85599  ORF Transcript_30287/g.85599 Transcript_30287/m.85599 type:complete len:157 (-) Transcript_30287:1103-1573(-)|eukprot:CAMPEP_0117651980 /NCGR_PEP_ID=MMETSP0804-20121206/2383_1 /TAXON_ID=1074897 /ORGANISM="Tetraselmis astigmatica, Strain CCMP880" /LENGTH=156 /DNA_ID=CAMNT_0005457997 /DNA_START=514 /DNA_END=984 /DNA_ORIENTATION=-